LHELEKFDSAAKAKKNIRVAIERVASRLGNTPAISQMLYSPRNSGLLCRRPSIAADEDGGRARTKE
jgi:hypothetical protein